MNTVFSVYTPGVIAVIEQFTLAYEELRQYVIYTYYNEAEEPLYVGASKSFYNAHYQNSQRLECWDEVTYVGFVFLEDEDNMRESKKYYIRARSPKFSRSQYKELPYLKGLDVQSDELVVSNQEMMQRWNEWLDGGDDDQGWEWDFLGERDIEPAEKVFPICLDGWEEDVGVDIPADHFEPQRGRETPRHYFANLKPEMRDSALENGWDRLPATEEQLFTLQKKFEVHDLHLARNDFTMLEALMLLVWADDFENLAKKPRFDLDYVCDGKWAHDTTVTITLDED